METGGMRIGWWLSSEEHDPRALVRQCQAAEAAGVPTAMISDHLQPWVPRQGQAPFVWSVLGAMLQATDAIEVGTGVTALGDRSHPVNVAQAMATCAVLSEGRTFLGVGTGERLNEQAFGEHWASGAERRDRVEEGITIIRDLWRGKRLGHRGTHWRVEHARVWTRPASPPDVFLAASGSRSAALAGRVADGMIAVSPDRRVVEAFRGGGGEGKRCVAQLHVCLAATLERARATAWEWWPNGVVPPALLGELADPEHFEAAANAIGEAAIDRAVICATGPEPIERAIAGYAGAGFDTVYLHQVGPDQDRLLRMVQHELLVNAAPPSTS
jgi:G6PDH family F420-dependent oxidoreductase